MKLHYERAPRPTYQDQDFSKFNEREKRAADEQLVMWFVLVGLFSLLAWLCQV